VSVFLDHRVCTSQLLVTLPLTSATAENPIWKVRWANRVSTVWPRWARAVRWRTGGRRRQWVVL